MTHETVVPIFQNLKTMSTSVMQTDVSNFLNTYILRPDHSVEEFEKTIYLWESKCKLTMKID